MKIPKFTLTFILIGIVFLTLRFGIRPQIPSSLLYFYLGIAVFAIILFISVSNQSLYDFYAPIKATIREKKRKPLRLAIFISLPILAASLTYLKISEGLKAPAELRSIHPAPPSQIQFRGRVLDLTGLENPLRSDKANYDKYVEEGAKIYFQNCFFCHGDNLDGKGPFAPALNPLPANFVDKGTIAQLQESYVFWRISKGGSGLPNEGAPWNTAMPVWEYILTEDEIWKVTMFIYEAAGVEPRTWKESVSDSRQQSPASDGHDNIVNKNNKDGSPLNGLQTADAGKIIYMKKCQYCHGIEGKGNGPAADFLSPRPRDLTKAKYKLKSTPGGELPTDQDIFDIISNGIRGTSMPAWPSLTENEIWLAVKYVKGLAKRFRRAEEKGRSASETVKIENPFNGKAMPSTDESIEMGKVLFIKLECRRCHGENGRGNGPNALILKDDWGQHVRPANLWRYWDFRGGSSTKDIYKTITTGQAGTPMPSFIDSASNEERWHIANYVRSIGPGARPKKASVIKSHFVTGGLPETPEDPLWDQYETNEFRLFGQILVEPKMFTPSTDVLYVKSLFNDKEIAFLVEWDDISESVSGTAESGDNIFPDEFTIQFPNQSPATTASERPYFLRGSRTLGVNLWNWNAIDGFKEANSNGIADQKNQVNENSDVKGTAVYKDGRHTLLYIRSLNTNDKTEDIQFEINKFIPVAFSIHDGHNGETDTKMSISTWYNLFLEKKERGRKIIYPIIAGLSIVLLEFVVLWRVR